MVSDLRVRGSESGAGVASSSAVDLRSMVRNGEEAALLMSEEMLSHLILSLCLAHLGPCDNITIDSNKQLPNSTCKFNSGCNSEAATYANKECVGCVLF